MRFARKSGASKKASFNKTPEEASSWDELKQGVDQNEEPEESENEVDNSDSKEEEMDEEVDNSDSKEEEMDEEVRTKKVEVKEEIPKIQYCFIYTEDAKRINNMFKEISDLDEKRKLVLQELRNAKKTLFTKRKSICYNCCKYGHSVAKCPEVPSSASEFCIYCKEEGHLFGKCPKTGGGDWCYRCKSTKHRIYFCPELTDDEPKSAFYTCNENWKIVKADEDQVYADLKRKREAKQENRKEGPPIKKRKTNNKIQNKIEKGVPLTVQVNGEDVKLVCFEHFYIKEEDAKILNEKKKYYLNENFTEYQLQQKLKKFRKLAEKNAGVKVCYHCQEQGHNFNTCPILSAVKSKQRFKNAPYPQKSENVKSKTKKECLQCRKKGHTLEDCRYNKGGNICFKCGSTEHALSKCTAPGNELKFAKCFVCNESGHLSKNCPDNPRGLYPQGGGCLLCGDVTHLKRDCPNALNQKKKQELTIGTIDDEKIEALEEEPSTKTNKSKKRKSTKVVQF